MNFSNAHKFSSLDSPLQLSHDDFFLLSQSAFSANMPSGMSLKIQCPESLYISLWLRISHSNNHIATILDFSHNATSGCVLQLLSEQDKMGYELCWFCNGSSLTYRAQSSKWIYLTCGYDAAKSKSWISVNNEPIIDCNTQSPLFQNKEVELGIGFWLGGNHREFCGELKELCIAERGIKSFDTCRGPEEAKSEDFYNSVLKETVSNMNEPKMGKLPKALKNFVNGVKSKVIPLHNHGRINNALSNTFQSSRWSVSLQINDKLIAFVGNFKDFDRSFSLELQEHLANFISYASKEDVIGAAHYLNKVCDLGYRIRISTKSSGILDIVVSDEDQDTPDFAREIISIDMRHFRDTAASMLVSALVSCVQTLYRNGDISASRAILMSHMKVYGVSSNHFIRDVEFAQNRFSEEGERASLLTRNLAIGGLDYLEYFKGKYCNHPFDDFEIRSDGEVFVCCPSYLPYSIGNAYKIKSVEEVKSSQMLFKIKDSIINQDFRYCRWLHCEKIKNGLGAKPEQAKIDYVPIDFRLSYDPTCNLWCPSCRTEKIVAKGEQREQFMLLTDEVVLPMLKSAKSCMMNGYGDVFASRACRKVLESANTEEFPNLKFDFITNGVLFTETEWGKFPNIHHMVRSIRVSIDAARKETYDQIRLGGDWDVLMNNLEFIASLRRRHVIEHFMISMVIQEGNFREMADFARMAKLLGCDYAIFEPIMNWNTFAVEEFERQAVHYSSHPFHAEFQRNLAKVFEILPISNAQTVPKLGSPGFETLASTNF